jgi:ribosomal protein L37AE/L43A
MPAFACGECKRRLVRAFARARWTCDDVCGATTRARGKRQLVPLHVFFEIFEIFRGVAIKKFSFGQHAVLGIF